MKQSEHTALVRAGFTERQISDLRIKFDNLFNISPVYVSELEELVQLREQVRMLRTDLKTAADYLDQTAACNSDKAISSQFRKTLAATEPKV